MANNYGGGFIPHSPINNGLTRVNTGLKVINGPKAGEMFKLEKVSYLVGRNDEMVNVSVDIDCTSLEPGPTTSVSRRHAEVAWRDGKLTVTDLKSSKGTTINGALLEFGQPQEVFLGARILFGGVEMEVVRHDTK